MITDIKSSIPLYFSGRIPPCVCIKPANGPSDTLAILLAITTREWSPQGTLLPVNFLFGILRCTFRREVRILEVIQLRGDWFYE